HSSFIIRHSSFVIHHPSTTMAAYKTDGFLSRTLADWACKLTFDDLSPEVVERAKLFWFDSLGCAIGGSQQEDAEILLEHHREMSGSAGGAGSCTLFVSGVRANPVDAAFLNSHMGRAMHYNAIDWKGDPCHPSDIICGPL